LEKKENINSELILKNVIKTPIFSFTPFTLLDYPDKTACIIWFAGCNMRCLYCYNPEIVTGEGKLTYSNILSFLTKRVGLLDGVVLSGGECTSAKGLIEFARSIRKIGMKIKLDTNGSNPHVVEQLINEDLIDYVALDFKASKAKYMQITGSKLYGRFEKTLGLLMCKQLNFEIRTTIHESLLSLDDINDMIHYLSEKGYKGKLYLQQFRNNTPTIGNLGYSKNSIQQSDFNTSSIEVLMRN
jgi:pyruvate formate lyase activating enzyme